jgi:hypothetical protein
VNAYGKHFLAAVTGADDSQLHWTLRPFWHDLHVQVHPDGLSVAARDDLTPAVTALAERPTTWPTPGVDQQPVPQPVQHETSPQHAA